jgi:glycosyltransferase involved in cell wall biosynthesis
MTAHLADDGATPLIVHIIPSPRGRGAQRAARILVDQLDEPGHVRHTLLGLFEGPSEVRVDLDLGYPAGRHTAEGFQPRLALQLRQLLARLDPVAVVAHGGDAMKYALPAVLGTGRALAYCVIGTYTGPSTWLHRFLWRRIMAQAKLVVAVGDEVLDECTGQFRVDPQRAVVIPNGRDPSEFHPRESRDVPGESTLLFVGALTAQKRPDRFVEVVSRLRAEGRHLRAVLVGDGPLAGTLASMATAHGIEFLGPRSDVPEILRSAEIFVFTSLPTGEGMPGVLIEAGLSGLPAVSTRVPGATAVVRDGTTGMIVDDSVQSMVSAVGRLLEDHQLRAAMGKSARARCESEFNLDLMAGRWRAALQSIVGN